MSNIKDVTNSQKDWEDFWYSPEKFGSWDYYNSESEGKEYKNSQKFNSYIEDVLSGKNNICKRESPLSE